MLTCEHCHWRQQEVRRGRNNTTLIYLRNNEVVETLNTSKVELHFREINISDFVRLMGNKVSLPKDLILNTISVIPYPQRVSSENLSGISTINNLTIALHSLSTYDKPTDENNPEFISKISNYMVPGINDSKLLEGPAQCYQTTVAGETPGGRHGTIRTGLHKVLTNVFRGVAISDIHINANQVGVNSQTLISLGVEESVDRFNRQILEKEKREGKVSVLYSSIDNHLIHNTQTIANHTLQINDFVFRRIRQGEYVYLLRNPSISMTSITALEVVDHPGENVIAVNPTQFAVQKAGDFDGDQGSIEGPQDIYEAYAAKKLMAGKNFIRSPNSGKVQLLPSDTHIYGLFVLTRFFENSPLLASEAYTLVHELPVLRNKISPILDEHGAIRGRQIFQEIIGKDVNFVSKTEWYLPEYCDLLNYWKGDHLLIIENGLILQGALDKKILGNGGLGGFFYVLYREKTRKECLDIINTMEIISVAVTYLYPLSVSINEYTLDLQTMAKFEIEKNRIEEEAMLIEDQVEKQILTREEAEIMHRNLTTSLITRFDILFSDPSLDVETNNLLNYLLINKKYMLFMEIFGPVGQILDRVSGLLLMQLVEQVYFSQMAIFHHKHVDGFVIRADKDCLSES